MVLLTWISVLLLLRGSHSYILLTANLDDVQAIAKQIAHSPVASQLNSILRRASNIIKHQLHSRKDDGYQHRSPRSNTLLSDLFETIQDNRIERRSKADSTPHDSYHHDYRRSQDDSRSNLPYNRRSLESKTVKETLEDQQASTMSQEFDQNVPSDHRESREVSRGDSDGKSNQKDKQPREGLHVGESSHQNGNTPIHQNEAKNTQKVEQLSRAGKQKKQPDGHSRKEENLNIEDVEKPKKDEAQRRTEDVVALGKNASFYLNSMKKIMENV